MTDIEDTYRIYLDGDIDEDKARDIIAELFAAHVESPSCNIEFVMNTGGGALSHGRAIFSELYSMSKRGGGDHHVTTKCRGEVASVATLIFQAGDERVGGALDIMTFHEPLVSFDEFYISAARPRVEEAELWVRQAVDVLMERATVVRKDIQRLMGPRDCTLTMAEAVAFGLADRIA